MRRASGLPDAVQQQDVQKAEQLLYRGADVEERDASGATALHWATWFRLDLITLLLERGADPKAANVNGETPVHWAAKCSNIQALKLFAERKGDLLSIRDSDGWSPFIMAAQWDNAPLLEWFYLRGVMVDEQDNMGRTALQWASYKGHKKAVQWLLSRQANVGHRDHEKMTALHWAALKGHEDVLSLLTEVGAVRLLFEADSAGDTAFALARQKKHHYIAAVLLKAWVFQKVIGRPYIFKCQYAAVCVFALLANWAVFVAVFAPELWAGQKGLVLVWALAGVAAVYLWTAMKFSDPGYLTDPTIVSQDEWIQQTVDDPAAEQMVHGLGLKEFASDADKNQSKLEYQRQLIHEARRQHDEDDRFLQQASFALRPKLEAATHPVAARRRRELEEGGNERYLELIDQGKFKQVCVVCRVEREMRSHHCNEIARCVSRMDHFCPWVDNAIGLNNQRQFVVFLSALEASLVLWFALALRFLGAEWTGSLPFLSSSAPLDMFVTTIIVLVVGLANFVWLGFVTLLILRHVAYMAANVTTFEVIVRPQHVVQRWPKKRWKLCGCVDGWFLEGLTPGDAFWNCLAFWSLDTDRDSEVFRSSRRRKGGQYEEMGNDEEEDQE